MYDIIIFMEEKIEKTLIIIKPDSVSSNQGGTIINILGYAGFEIKKMSVVQFTIDTCELFYKEHINKPFFNDLKQFMISGPSWCLVVERQNAIKVASELCGHTNPNLADCSSIRGMFGDKEKLERNAVHRSATSEEFNTEFKIISQLSGWCVCK